MSVKSVLVLGGTGNQGWRVCAHLNAQGWEVTAFTRDPDTDRARALAGFGVRLHVGDPADAQDLTEAMDGKDAVVSIQTAEGYPDAGVDYRMEDEIALGVAAAEAAAKTRPTHFLYHSVGGSQTSPVRNWRAKAAIERRIRDLSLPATILRPASFMENYTGPRSGVESGVLRHILKPDTVEQLICLDDVGAFATLVLDDPDRFIGSTLDIAGDALTPVQVAAILASFASRPIPYEMVDLEAFVPFADSRDNPHRRADMLAGAQWFNTVGYTADIGACRLLLPGLKTFSGWMKAEGAEQLSALLGGDPAP